MAVPQLWLFAGPNGAGKTTFTRFPEWSARIEHFLNADELTRELLLARGYDSYRDTPAEVLQHANIEAAEKVFASVRRLLAEGAAVAVETVLSTDKYQPVVRDLRRNGGLFNLIYVGLRSAELSRERVARRVAQGGHPVPESKLPGRWRRSLEQLPWFASHADHFYSYDNSDSDPARPPALVALAGDVPGRLRVLDAESNPSIVQALTASGKFQSVQFG